MLLSFSFKADLAILSWIKFFDDFFWLIKNNMYREDQA